MLLSGSTLAIALNLAYNIVVAHFLGTKGFGNANALYTLLTLISAVTLAFQIVTAKIVAQQNEEARRDAAYRDLQRAAWGSGLLVAITLVLFQHRITSYLNLPSATMVTILAVGAAFYVPLGSRRGYIQGAHGFGKLATNLVLEGAARLVGSLLMVVLGLGVTGVIVANAAAILVAYFAIAPKLDRTSSNPLSFEDSFGEVSRATVFFAGQVLINNCDLVLVKHFFSSGDAGIYAAIALVGRVVFACSSAIVNSMFPVIAGSRHEERKNLSLIGTALGLVLAVGTVVALGLRFTPYWIWTALFGSSFRILGPHGFPYLLSLYATTTVVYCLSVVVMTYEMSYKIANTNWLHLFFSVGLIAGICRYHASLEQVIVVQLVMLIGFFVLIAVPFLFGELIAMEGLDPVEGRNVRLVRRISEAAVISEFLKSEFQKQPYCDYSDSIREIVLNPNLEDKAQCSARRSLLALRHRALWRELPNDTEWYEAEVGTADLPRIRVFPRAQWARIALGNFSITKVAERVRSRQQTARDPFVGKISEIREGISEDALLGGSVILIGRTASDVLTVLDGNHRFVAGLLEGKVESLKFVCGLSPKMTQCCWYKTNLLNLIRYSRNRMLHFLEVPNADSFDLYECPDVTSPLGAATKFISLPS